MPKSYLCSIFCDNKSIFLPFFFIFFCFFKVSFAQIFAETSAVNGVFCLNDEITITARNSTNYTFLVNGATVQSSPLNSYTTVLTKSSVIRVLGDQNDNFEISLKLNAVQAPTISGTQEICFGEDVTLNLITHGSVDNVELTGTGDGYYQWQSSLDRINWIDVPGAITSILTVPSLIKNTFF